MFAPRYRCFFERVSNEDCQRGAFSLYRDKIRDNFGCCRLYVGAVSSYQACSIKLIQQECYIRCPKFRAVS